MSKIRVTLILISLSFWIASCSPNEVILNQTSLSDQWESIPFPAWYDYSAHDTISVLTWNLEHFVDDYDNPYIDNERENNPDDYLTVRREMLAEALIKLDADIVVLQEVESAAYMQALSSDFFDELNYQYFTSKESNDWYMNVIIMSRIPLGLLYSYANAYTFIEGQMDDGGQPDMQNFTNNRMLSVDVHVNPTYSFTLTGVHLKAGRGDRNEGWRIGQVNLLHEHYSRILSMNPNRRIMIAGDLNMLPGDPDYAHILGTGSELEFIDPMANFDSPTHMSDNPTRQLDYILANRNMMGDIVPESSTIPMPFEPRDMRLISDHLPVIIKIVTTD